MWRTSFHECVSPQPHSMRSGRHHVVFGLLLLLFWAAQASGQTALRIVTVVPAAANTGFPDEDGDYPAYIEIRAATTLALSGHFLTDQANLPGRWQVPQGYNLTGGQTLRIFASGKDRRPIGPNGILHTSFAYDCLVPFCGLSDSKLAAVDQFTDRTDRCACRGGEILGPKSMARYLVPLTEIGTDWTLPGFNDKGWYRGVTGIGYEVGTTPYLQGLVLYHTLDKADLDGLTVKDVSGPILHPGAVVGDLSMVAGRIHQGLDYQANPARHVRVEHHSELDPGAGAFSVALWFKPLRGGSATVGNSFSEVLVSKLSPPGGATQTGQGWMVFRNQTGTFVQINSALGSRTVPLGQTAAGQWNHVVLVVDRGTSRLVGYLNGKRIGFAALSGGATEVIASTAPLLEGRDAGGAAPFAGVLDDVAIWSLSLNDAQVQELYSVGQQGKSFLDGTAFPAANKMYTGLIGTDVLGRMRGINTSIYIRVPFNLPSVPSLATGLRLRVHYDDGFIAYLNGAEVARRNAPLPADSLSAADTDRPDAQALTSEIIDLSSYLGLLKPGGNVLAFHAMSADAGAVRFVLAPAGLCLEIDRPTTPPEGNCVKETNGRDFWVAFPENYSQEPDTPLRLSLCIAGPPGTQGAVDVPGLVVPGFPRNFTVPPSGALVMTLPRQAELSGPESIEPKGIHIVASADVAVYGTTRMDYTSDTFLGLPTKCLGTDYLVTSYRNVFQGIPILNGTQFAIVAVANGTVVSIRPRTAVGSHPANVAFLIKLDRGETYQLRNEDGQPADLTGTEIRSTKPIGVFGSHRCANVQSVNQFFCDTVVEELLPIPSWGDSYFVVPLATRKSDTLRILSGADANLVTVTTTAGAQSFNLQRGELREFQMDRATRITCRGPAQVMQFANSSDYDQVTAADPFMTLIQPAPTWLSQYRFCTPGQADFENNYINLVGPSQSTLDLTTVNGTALSAWNPAEIVRGSFPGGAAFAQVKLKPATAYLVIGRTAIGMTAYGFSEYDSYGYPGGMRFTDTSAPVIVCPKEVTLNCQSVPGAAGCVARVPDFTRKTEIYDDCTPEGKLSVTQTPPAGTLLQPGFHTVTLVVVDGRGNQSQCVISLIVDSKWAEQEFGPSIASNPALEATVWGASADPDKDGLSNAMEEAVGTNPNQQTPLSAVLKLSTELGPTGAFPVVSIPRLLAEVGPAVTLEGVDALDGSFWESGPDLFEELPEQASEISGGKHERVVYRIRHPSAVNSATSYFLRLKLGP